MADLKITELPAALTVAAGDVLPLVSDPVGTPATSKATVAQLAAAVMALVYPVGITIELDSDPATALGFGTWQAVGAGRVPVGLDAGDPDFDTVGKTGGAKTVTLTEAQLPSHSHPVTDPGHAHVEQTNSATTGGLSGWAARDTSTNTASPTSYSTLPATTGVTVDSAGSGEAHPNMPPYIVVRRWLRTA